MLKNILKKTFKYTLGANVLTAGFGIASFYQINNLKKHITQKTNQEIKLKENKNLSFDKLKEIQEKRSFDIPTRNENLEKIQQEKFDILILGGGSAGAGVLLDAYTRGFKCGLIESFDFASGTSSRSSKLIHGGLRYLEDAFAFDLSKGFKERKEKFGLVNEALNERDFVRNSALFMNNSMELVINAKNLLMLMYYFNGALLYQLLYFISYEKSKLKLKFNNYFPWVKLDIFNKKIYLYEGQFNDSRQNVLSILTCLMDNYKEKSSKATAINYTDFKEYIYDKETNKIIGIKAYDKINNKNIEIFSKIIVNCTGILGDDNFDQKDKMAKKMIKASKGTHLIFKDLNLKESIMIPKTSDGRVLFILPYQDYFLAGTTDAEDEKNLHPNVLEKEENFIINEMVNYNPQIFSEENLKKSLSSKWAGERPLVCEKGFDGKTNSKSLSRSHVIRHDKDSNLYSLMGGKWTTYRNMGEEIVDEILKNEEELRLKDNKRKSKYIKLRGSLESYNEKFNKKTFNEENYYYDNYLIENLRKNYPDIEDSILKNLIKRYGIYALNILKDGEKEKTNKVLFKDFNYLESEVRYVIRNEMAIKPNDIICRRLGIGFLNDELSKKAIPIVSEIIADELKMEKDNIAKMNEEAFRNFDIKL